MVEVGNYGILHMAAGCGISESGERRHGVRDGCFFLGHFPSFPHQPSPQPCSPVSPHRLFWNNNYQATEYCGH